MTIELGNRLAELRKQHGLSQEELADQLGVSRQAVSKWERGEASPDTDNLIELARIYGISLDELLGLKKEDSDNDNINVHVSTDDADIHVSGTAHIVDDEDEVHIDNSGIHIKDGDGSEVHITKGGINIKDEEGETRHVKVQVMKDRKQRINALVSLLTTIGVVITYILLGSLAGLWGQAWTLFLLLPVVPTLAEAIIFKNGNIFAYPIFVAFVYLTLCAWVLPAVGAPLMWHPLWVMFLTVPVYYGVCNFIKARELTR